MPSLVTKVGRTELRNPLIAGPADHFIDEEGVRRALKTGVGALVLKSVNETQNAKDHPTAAIHGWRYSAKTGERTCMVRNTTGGSAGIDISSSVAASRAPMCGR